ncbi:hypothetical protein [Fodinicola acaciae]|uniref:hypothetical protein n=1 Tax=Fodinicola acaciae TaxID=2681555 RepID=UPI0013D8833B|nr:hypothetical protein [Fodinicola acaciae]
MRLDYYWRRRRLQQLISYSGVAAVLATGTASTIALTVSHDTSVAPALAHNSPQEQALTASFVGQPEPARTVAKPAPHKPAHHRALHRHHARHTHCGRHRQAWSVARMTTTWYGFQVESR